MLLLAVAAGAIAAALVSFFAPNLAGRVPSFVVPAAAVAGAVVLAFADTAPTGGAVVDLVFRAGFGALVPLAAARAGTFATAWLLVVASATLLVADAPAAPVTAIAAGAFLAVAAAGTARPGTAAVAAAAGIGPLAYADWPLATGASAAAMAVATMPVLFVGLVRTGRPLRGRIVAGLALAVIVAGLGSVAALAAALSAKGEVDTAIELAESGVDRLGDDDRRAQDELQAATAGFDDAEDTIRAWWARPALLVPGVAQQSRAVSTMASAGADLARTAADASEDADLDSARPRNGQVDLDALAALVEPLDRSLTSLHRADDRLADIESPLLVAPVAERLVDLREQVDDALGSAELAAQAIAVAPDLLGADGPRRYFVAVQNPSELTGNGGFMGNWAELVADGGRLELARAGRVSELTRGGPDPEGRRIESVPEFTDVWGQHAGQYWGTINYSPDHPTVSRVIAELYPKSGGQELDGVISLTPAAFAGFLELTGPIDVAGYPDRLQPDNAEQILLHEQYFTFPEQDAGGDRRDFLAEAIDTLFEKLTGGDLPGPSVLAEELGPAVEARDLQLWSVHPQEQALFERIGATGDVSRRGVDSFGVVTQNFNGNKIDWFLHRELGYDATWDPDSGAVSGTVTARIENRAPAEGLPPSIIGWGGDESAGQRPVADGENFMHVSVYATFPIETVTVDGESVPFVADTEVGHHAARLYLSVPSMTTKEIVATFDGQVSETGRYTIRPLRQATVNPDQIRISMTLASGWQVEETSPEARTGADGGSTTLDSVATERTEMVVETAPTASGPLDRLRGTP